MKRDRSPLVARSVFSSMAKSEKRRVVGGATVYIDPDGFFIDVCLLDNQKCRRHWLDGNVIVDSQFHF